MSSLLTTLVVQALESAGRAAFVEKPKALHPAQRVPVDAVLEGEIHSFWLEQHTSIALYADISLTLRNPASGDPLWIRDVPEDSTLPVWSGPGEWGMAGVGEADHALREMFLGLFADKDFTSALEAVSKRSSHLPAPTRATARPDARTHPRF